MIMLCSLALDPFFQQVVNFPERWALQNETTGAVPRAIEYHPAYIPEFFQGLEQQQVDQNFAPVIKKYLYENGTKPIPFGNGTRPDIPLSCPTSNCTWPPYETLAVCSSCAEVSHLLNITYQCRNATIDWSSSWTGPLKSDPYPNGTVCGYYLNATSTSPILLSGYRINDTSQQRVAGEALLVRAVPLTDFDTKTPLYGVGSVNFKNIRNPLLDALIASAVNGTQSVYRNEPPLVHECVLSWCVQTLTSSYGAGKYVENVTSTYLDVAEEPSSWPWTSFEDETGVTMIYSQNVTLEPPTSTNRSAGTVFNHTYSVGKTTVANAMFIFDDFFPSSYTAQNATAEAVLRYKNYEAGPFTRYLTFNPWLAPNNITAHMERLASALTSVVRSSDSNLMTPGPAFNKENFVSVRWEWLTLPLGLLCISFVFLAATVAKSAIEIDRLGIYKSSAYATLLYGLSDELQHKITRSGSTGTPRAKAKELKVKLQPNQGWRVSGNLFSPFTPKPKNQPPPGWI
jgi:hypothetical protein